MAKGPAVTVTALAATSVPLQAAMNSTLGKRIGTLPASAYSLITGAVILVVLALLAAGTFLVVK